MIANKIYLASQSARRRDLLKQIGVQFEPLLLRSSLSRGVDVDETPLADEPPSDYVQRVCLAKAAKAWDVLCARNLPHHPILTADTTVALDNKILGKPCDRAEATEMLRRLSGKQHQVLTAVALILGEHCESRLSITNVRFATLDEARINHYFLTNEAYDKAGAYGIQGLAGAFVERIDGSYTGVVGLPLYETVELLNLFGETAP